MSNDLNLTAIAFILGAALPTFEWTVRVPVPTKDDYLQAELVLQFQAVDQVELDKMRGVGLSVGEAAPTDAEIFRRVVVGWPSLKNNTGAEVAFSPAAVEQLLASPLVRTATVATYLAAMQGMAARKNV